MSALCLAPMIMPSYVFSIVFDKARFPGEPALSAGLPTTLPVGRRSGQWSRVHGQHAGIAGLFNDAQHCGADGGGPLAAGPSRLAACTQGPEKGLWEENHAESLASSKRSRVACSGSGDGP